MKSNRIVWSCVWGGLFGLICPAALFAMKEVLNLFGVSMLRHQGSAQLLFLIGDMENPPVGFGNLLHLQILNHSVPFIFYDLNVSGYFFVLLFWAVIGLAAGAVLFEAEHAIRYSPLGFLLPFRSSR